MNRTFTNEELGIKLDISENGIQISSTRPRRESIIFEDKVQIWVNKILNEINTNSNTNVIMPAFRSRDTN